MENNGFVQHVLSQQSEEGSVKDPLAKAATDVSTSKKSKGGNVWIYILAIILIVLVIAGIVVLLLWVFGVFDYSDEGDNGDNGNGNGNRPLPDGAPSLNQIEAFIRNFIAENPNATRQQIADAVAAFISGRNRVVPLVQDVLIGQRPLR
jgi:flagellar basal body-associated protein FliL